MTLFESPSQYREKTTIWQVFKMLPLYGALAGGEIWQWFAINIPMDMGTSGSSYTSDVDILAKLKRPPSWHWHHRAWEVKVSLIGRDGSARSLKVGKLRRTVQQLEAYRNFGIPDVSLLDIFLCEDGYLRRGRFPSGLVADGIEKKKAQLCDRGFGYEVLPFEMREDSEKHVRLIAMPDDGGLKTTFGLTPARASPDREPFSRFARRIQDFFDAQSESARPRKNFEQVTLCRACRRLLLIDMKEIHICPSCGDNLIQQS